MICREILRPLQSWPFHFLFWFSPPLPPQCVWNSTFLRLIAAHSQHFWPRCTLLSYCTLFLEHWPTMPRFNGTQCIPIYLNISEYIPMLIHKISQIFTLCSGPGNQPISTPNPPDWVQNVRPRLGSLHRSPRIRYQHLRPVPGQCDTAYGYVWKWGIFPIIAI